MIRQILMLWVMGVLAGLATHATADTPRSYLEVSPRDTSDLNSLFNTLEESLEYRIENTDPVIVILHGEEAASFTLNDYPRNRSLLDRAALLDAYNLIDVRMCETWMQENGVENSDLPAFIETVPYAPEEIRRLEADGYRPYREIKI